MFGFQTSYSQLRLRIASAVLPGVPSSVLISDVTPDILAANPGDSFKARYFLPNGAINLFRSYRLSTLLALFVLLPRFHSILYLMSFRTDWR